jgi:hypothetical protein
MLFGLNGFFVRQQRRVSAKPMAGKRFKALQKSTPVGTARTIFSELTKVEDRPIA